MSQTTEAAGRGALAERAPAPVALGKNADFVSPSLPPPSTVRSWHLRHVARDLLWRSGTRVRLRVCGQRISRNGSHVQVYARPDRAYGRVGGVCVCGQSLCCPVCAPRIAARRGEEVSVAYERARNAGYAAGLVTFTIPHDRSTNLTREIDVFADAWRTYSTGKGGVRLRADALGNQVGREVTYGQKNGWHYHHHQQRFDKPDTFDVEYARSRWLSALKTVGRYSEAAEKHAFDFEPITDRDGSRYVAKLALAVEARASIGLEIAGGSMKGRNFNSLLADAANGDDMAENTWVSGVRSVCAKKVSSVRWSRGLRGKLMMADEKSDEQIAEEERTSTDELLGYLNAAQWRGVLFHRCELALCCAANRGRDAVNEFLAGLSLGQLDDPSPYAVEDKQTGPQEEQPC